MKNLIILSLIILCTFGCQEELTEAEIIYETEEDIANLVEHTWRPTNECLCMFACNIDFIIISSTKIHHAAPGYANSWDVAITQSSDDPYVYLDENGEEHMKVIEVSETDVILRFNYTDECIFIGERF